MPGASEQPRPNQTVPPTDVVRPEARKVNEAGVDALEGIWREITKQPYWQEFMRSRQQPLRITMIGMGQRIEEIIALQRILGGANVRVIDNNPEALSAAQARWQEFQLGHPETKDIHVQFETVDLANVEDQREKADLLVAHNLLPSLISVLFEGRVPKLVGEGGLVITTLARPMDVGLIDLRYAWRTRPHLAHWMPQVELVVETNSWI